MRALVDEGVNIIIDDDIILEPGFLIDYLDAFKRVRRLVCWRALRSRHHRGT